MLLLLGNKVVFQEMGRFWIFFFFLGRHCHLEYVCLHVIISDFAVVKIVFMVMGAGESEV